MGQKTNPNILRLGVTKSWKSEFFENKPYELPLYNFKILEIKDYLFRFFRYYNIIVYSCDEYFHGCTLHLNVSYFISSNFVYKKFETKNSLVIINNLGNRKIIKTNNYVKSSFPCIVSLTKLKLSKEKLYQFKIYLRNSQTFKLINYNQLNNPIHNDVVKKLFKTLDIFVGGNSNLSISFNCLNKDLAFLKPTQYKSFLLLQKFRNIPFTPEGIELLFYVVHSKNSAMLLARFIGDQIQKTKRHKFFISFLKHFLTILLSSKLTIIKGIKIMIKGRLNGVPRAKHKTVIIGDVPIQTFDTQLDFHQTVIHNSNGSYGISVWLVEKI